MTRGSRDRALLAVLFAGLALLHWGRWADPVVDFGRELYTAWRLSSGDKLYSGLAHLHGPLSQWFNGLVFSMTGPSLRALVAMNLLVLALETHLLHRLLRRVGGRRGAFAGTAVFLTLFGFGDFTTYGVFNHVTPYSHEATHGLLLALAALEAGISDRPLLSGLLWGLCALTKPEPALAALAGLSALRPPAGKTARFVSGALGVPFLCWAVLSLRMGMRDAAWAVSGSWAAPLAAPAAVASIYSGSFASAPALSWDWLDWAQALPLAVGVLAWRTRRRPASRAFAVFSLAMLAKILLAARIHHYGFTLAAPATALLAAAAVGIRPSRRVGRWAAAVFVAALSLSGAVRSLRTAENRTFVIGAGEDAFLCDKRGEVLAAVMPKVTALLAPGATLAVWPEGAMVNYLLRRRNPTPYLNLLPIELALWGEGRILAAYREAPPDAILLVHRETAGFGAAVFGRDYGQDLLTWAHEGYREVGGAGDPPLRPGSRFGVRLLLRRADPLKEL